MAGPWLACTAWEASRAHRFHRKCPKSPKSAKKGGTPLFDQFFSKASEIQTLLAPIFEKKVLFSPYLGHPSGGKTALFSENRRIRGVHLCKLPRIVFLEGGPISPCSGGRRYCAPPGNQAQRVKAGPKGPKRAQRGKNCPKYCHNRTKTGQESLNFKIIRPIYARGWSLRQHVGLK